MAIPRGSVSVVVAGGNVLEWTLKNGMVSSETIDFIAQPEEGIMDNAKQPVQGDVMFIPIEGARLPQALEPVDGLHVIARGEKTGHTHTVDAKSATLFEGRDILVVDVDSTEVIHDKHPPLALDAGTYRIRLQEEIDLREAVAERPQTRRVWD